MPALRTAAVTALALLALAAPAGADITPLESRNGLLAGPLLAGGDAVWVEPRPALGLAVRARTPGGPVRAIADLSGSPQPGPALPPFDGRRATLLASSSDLVVGSQPFGGSTKNSIVGPEDAFTGPLAGPLAPIDPGAAPLRVTDGAAAYGSYFRGKVRVVARDGSGAERVFADALLLDLAGATVALRDERGTRITDWRTGEDLYRMDDPAFQLRDLQADGLALWRSAESSGPQLLLSSPEQRRPQPLPVDVPAGQAVLAGDRVAFVEDERITIVDRDGRLVGLARADGFIFGSLAFDGRTVAWGSRRCVLTRVLTWTLGASPPVLPSSFCTAAGPPPDSRVRVRRDGAVVVPVACSPAGGDGCPTGLAVLARPIRAGRPVGQYRRLPVRRLALFAGERETVVVRTVGDLQRRIRSSRRLDLLVVASTEATTASSAAAFPPERRRFTVDVPR